MKCSYQDLDGSSVEITCESYIHIPSGAGVNKIAGNNRSADLIHITEDFSFLRKHKQIQYPSIDLLLMIIVMFLIVMSYQLWHRLEQIGRF